MGSSSSIEYKTEIIHSDIWPKCNIYELEIPITTSVKNNIFKYSIEYNSPDPYYSIPKGILFLDILNKKCKILIFSDKHEETTMHANICASMIVNLADNQNPISSNFIKGNNCFSHYKTKKGVEGIMRMRLDLFNYIENVLQIKGTSIFIDDTAYVDIKYSKQKKRKLLMLHRMMDPHVRYFSIYDKYAEPFAYSNDMMRLAEKLKNTKFEDIELENKSYIEYNNNNYNGKLLYIVLLESENIKEDDERYQTSGYDSRFVDIYYNDADVLLEIETVSERKLTFDSLKKYFESNN